ncbi:hypothetical protein I5535_11380 [Rhodobacteraceae bacterium F11138]|nr:hypothetical protein [Rhodobacteraceae bacterium F11138]
MTEIRDGFFRHPDGDAPVKQMQRLLAGEHNPTYDGLFSTTISEVDGEIREAELLRRKLLSQLVEVRRKLVSLRADKEEIEQAVRTFEETGEIAEVLLPTCDAMVAKEQASLRKADEPIRAEEIDDAKADLSDKLPDRWDIAETTADEEFVYVTIKRRRAVVAAKRPSKEETRSRIIERVRQAFETYRTDFLERARPLRLMAVPANPRASP